MTVASTETNIAVDEQHAAATSFVSTYNKKKSYLFFKRTVDIIVSSLALVILLIPMALIALFVRLDSPGAPIFVHKRIGKNRKPLALYKFRTMHANADKMIEQFTPEQMAQWKANFKLDDDPRITRIGKFLRRTSLDELPQLLNILKGDLSIVGPRPVVSEELEKYGDNKDKFLSVTPGLTGYWQAYARNTCSYEQRMRMELFYVEKANFWWDVKIILATFGAVIRGDGAK